MTQKHNITFGDLVHVDGYDDRPFFVDSWTEETRHEPNVIFEEVWFDITCAWTGEYHMAELDDITRICDAAHADDYLLYHASPYVSDMLLIGRELDFDTKPREVPKLSRKPERKPTQRELSSQEAERRKQARKEREEQIDNLLDIRNWNVRKYVETSERAYRMKVEEIDEELAKLAEEGRR